ncbi:hypothetical protein RJB97_05040 [Staphylococcus epidermidis]|uniref:hypothetical protein n=1 Tax=Bacillati TaxID=1783272 RepID=UPI000CD3B9C3|nr:hypothetical protein [Staphylococcus epidermidis]KAB2212126.1 hypothetical protein F9B19_05475 [Staphylococcus epidermidis]MDS3919908.1 hypothetical protein [Staphylococcus epidermidis]MEB6727209.1 hypothetical protein [Staphylococcus epidermidis]
MKKFLVLIFASLLVLGACGQSEDNSKKDDDKKSESKSDKKSNDPKKDKKSDDKEKSANESKEQNSSSTEEKNNENQNNNNKQNTQDNSSNENHQNTQSIDITNIKDRGTLESVIYGNYSETEKIQAYNSAVANGVIPQGNVMEGPASAAYESSLRVESGQEKSIYENVPQSSGGTDAGMTDYDEVNKSMQSTKEKPSRWVQEQIEWAEENGKLEDN